MANPPASQYRSRQQARETAFLSEYCRFEANWEFHRARLKALVRRLVALVALRNRGTPEWEGILRVARAVRVVQIDAIIGFIDLRGKVRSYLPIMSRRLATAWRLAFCADGSEPGTIEAVQASTGDWCLMGGPTSLLRLEVLRAKGFSSVRILLTAGYHAPNTNIPSEVEGTRESERACIAC
jgi:hypothetical protein